MSIFKKLVAANIRKYIEAKEVRKDWVAIRIGITTDTFFDLLEGKGNVALYEQKILELFRIKDPYYFHQKEIELPKSIVEKSQDQQEFTDLAVCSFQQADINFKEGMRVFGEVVELLDVLKNLSLKD